MRLRRLKLWGLLARLRADRRGNVLMILAFAIIPLLAATGIAVDYSRAARLRTKLNAAADAAALAAVTQPMMDKTDADARLAAIRMFNVQATGLPGLIYDPDNLTVGVTSTTGAVVSRTVTVSYAAQSRNVFGGVLNALAISIAGESEAYASNQPNIDFYMMLDTSPSMALPATTAGLQAMVKATPTQGDGKGCAFACHQTDTSSSSPGGTDKVNGKYVDNYYIAKTKLKLTLRSDLTKLAVQDLTNVAKEAAATNKATYRMALATFDWTYRNILAAPTNLDTAKSEADKIELLPVCRNNQRVCGTNDNDTLTNFNAGKNGSSIGAFAGALANLPLASGGGTNQPGDTPQAMLFIITDGMRDESNGGRKLGPITTSQCKTIKDRNIRIAILYTEYLPESASDNWSITNVRDPYLKPSNEKISPALMECASSGLFYKVTTNSDISSALAMLFQKAIATAHVTR
jgi:Flp pilus assembly protein TadG